MFFFLFHNWHICPAANLYFSVTQLSLSAFNVLRHVMKHSNRQIVHYEVLQRNDTRISIKYIIPILI